MQSEHIHKILVNTRNYIAKHGWTRGQYATRTGEVCLMGGFERVVDRSHIQASERPMFARALGFTGKSSTAEAVWWNDRVAKSKEEVLARLDKAIAETAPEPQELELSTDESISTLEENKNVKVCA